MSRREGVHRPGVGLPQRLKSRPVSFSTLATETLVLLGEALGSNTSAKNCSWDAMNPRVATRPFGAGDDRDLPEPAGNPHPAADRPTPGRLD